MGRRVVVVGSGIAGLSAAHTLCLYGDDIEVVIVEAENRVGGHSYTVSTKDGEDIDIGFMVMNDHTYPNLINLFKDISAEVETSDMSLAVFDDPDGAKKKGFSWSFQGSRAWMIDNLFRVRLWQFVAAHRKFARLGLEFIHSQNPTATIGEFAAPLDPLFVDKWLVPFIGAVWSTSPTGAKDFLAFPILRFMYNHQFLTLDTVTWRTPKERSQRYVAKLLAHHTNLTVRTNARAASIDAENKAVVLANGERISYDAVILAGSAPSQVALNPPAKQWLSQFRTTSSRIVCHDKPYGMSPEQKDWSSWNVTMPRAEQTQDGPRVTYWLSRLQNLKNPSIFLTLNPTSQPEGTFFETTLEHPVIDLSAFRGQEQEAANQGIHNVFHAGAWLRNGFHEDGCVTGIIAARRVLGRDDIPVEYPTQLGLPAESVYGESTHVRNSPDGFEYKVKYPLYMYRFDVAAPPPGFARTDHFGDPSIPLDTCVRRQLRDRVGYWPLGKIEALCNLRCLGFCFNSITPYFAHDEKGKLQALLLEVHNTPWGERTTYAMRVLDGGVLEPAVHDKNMHVSPFNPPPSSSPSPITCDMKYKFTLVGKEYLNIEVTKTNSTSLVSPTEKSVEVKPKPLMTASWKVLPGGHSVKTGSWRMFFLIYWQAILLVTRGMPMFSYNTPALSWSSPLLLSQGGFAAVALAHVMAGGSFLSGMAFAALAMCNVAHHRAQGVNVVLLPILVGLALICLVVNAVGLLSYNNALEQWVCAISSSLCFGLSLVSSAKFVELRTVSYSIAALGSMSLVVPVPLWAHAACAWFTLRVITDTLSFTGFWGLLSLMVHSGSVLAMARTHINIQGMALVFLSSHVLEILNAVGYAHVFRDLLFSSGWNANINMLYFGLCVVLNPGIPRLLSGTIPSFAYEWNTLTFLFCVHLLKATAFRWAESSLSFKTARDYLIIKLLNVGLGKLTDGQIAVTLATDEIQAANKGNHENDLELQKGPNVIEVREPFPFFESLRSFGELGLGESFVRGEWNPAKNTDLFHILMALAKLNDSSLHSLRHFSPSYWAHRLRFLLRFGTLDRKQAADSIAEHYDDDGKLFEAMLGEDRVYTCAMWRAGAVYNPNLTLAEAQRAKVHRILDLAGVGTPGVRRVLDIGCGWGYLVHAAHQRGVEALGLCNSKEMIAHSRRKFGDSLYSLMDYRDIRETHDFDAITSVEMIEAVPAKDYKDFVASCDRALRPGGRVVMQVINALSFNNPVARSRTPEPLGAFVTTHIFPGQQLPNLEFLHEAFLNSGQFKRVYSETATHDYARTLACWKENLMASADKFPAKMVRKYLYYLAYCQAGFETELLHLTRVVFEKRDE